MNYQVRRAEDRDFPGILALYAGARAFMAASGNPDQWGRSDPPRAVLQQDLQGGNLYVITENGRLHGVFMFRIFEDPTYRVIAQGSWHRPGPYGVIHRVAGDGSGGILKAAVAYGEQFADYLRIDTHRQNLPMQRAILSRGFSYCGVIFTARGDPRLAYDRYQPAKAPGTV